MNNFKKDFYFAMALVAVFALYLALYFLSFKVIPVCDPKCKPAQVICLD